MFRDVPARPNYVELEHKVLRLWAETQAFEKLRAQTRGGLKWSFLDGPITANNAMGVHHAWGRTYKDLDNRYHAMLGQELRWQQGFDCQGLWVEVAVEKELGFTNKRQIEEFGVAEFVNKCKERVYHYAGRITEQSRRLGYWMDWDNSYFTLSDENNYSIWGFLKLCHERGWLYRGHDVMPWCPRCGTALSEHEIATEGYAEKSHVALTVAFPLLDRPGEALLTWTTTPWTLPANVAAAVNPELTYVRVEQRTKNKEQSGERGEPTNVQRPTINDQRPTGNNGQRTTDNQSFWLAKGVLETQNSIFNTQNWQVLEERPGSDLVGWRYRGPFDELAAQAGVAHRVVPWSEVSEGEGVGVVHIAPGAGKEDFTLGREHGLPVLAPLDDDGVYVAGYGWLTGHRAGDVAEDVAADLEHKRLLFGRELYTHRYPVCWRCGSELVFRLVDEWLISMDELRHQMMHAARMATWIPAFGLERELDWLRNMDDWMISKKRYWGLVLPIYPCAACGHVTVVGSKEELRERAVAGWEQFEGHSPHRPWVDAVLVACEACGAAAARVPDVGNPWLDAGIVAFSTLGYRHDRAYWEQWYPADLVLESFPGQFRNWFYALLAMSVAIDGRAPFKTLLGYALVKDEHGEEMHKSKGNAIWFEEAAEWLGVEPLRWLFASAPLDRNIHFGHGLVEATTRRLQPLWEVYRFFVTYANLEERLELRDWRLEATPSLISDLPSALDSWLFARLNQLVQVSREHLDTFDTRSFATAIEAFLDDLSNWYVRRSRRRFWGGQQSANNAVDRREPTVDQSSGDKHAAFATLYTTLVTLARLLAPVLPFLSEELYQNLVRSVDLDAPVSVHLTGYPVAVSSQQQAVGSQQGASLLPGADWRLLSEMEVVRRVVGLGRVARKQAGLRVRQPLARMLVGVGGADERAALLRHQKEVLEELNVKTLEVLDTGQPTAGYPQGVSLRRYRVKPNLRLLGARLGKRLPALRAALDALDESTAAAVARAVAAGETVLLPLDGGPLVLAPEELLVESSALEGYAVAQEGDTQVALDTALDAILRREGLARDLVRAVQEARKAAGLALADRITLYVSASERDGLRPLLDEWGAYVQGETLAESLVVAAPPADAYAETVALDGMMVTVGVARRT